LLRRSIEQDPLTAAGYSAIGQLYRSMLRPTDAEKAFRKAIELLPSRISTHFVLGCVLADQGRDAEALAEVNLEPAEWGRLTGLAYVHHLAGRSRESDQALRELEVRHPTDSPFQIAAI